MQLRRQRQRERQRIHGIMKTANTRRLIFLSISGLGLRPYEFSSWTVDVARENKLYKNTAEKKNDCFAS